MSGKIREKGFALIGYCCSRPAFGDGRYAVLPLVRNESALVVPTRKATSPITTTEAGMEKMTATSALCMSDKSPTAATIHNLGNDKPACRRGLQYVFTYRRIQTGARKSRVQNHQCGRFRGSFRSDHPHQSGCNARESLATGHMTRDVEVAQIPDSVWRVFR